MMLYYPPIPDTIRCALTEVQRQVCRSFHLRSRSSRLHECLHSHCAVAKSAVHPEHTVAGRDLIASRGLLKVRHCWRHREMANTLRVLLVEDSETDCAL